jgi:hypothetical protein
MEQEITVMKEQLIELQSKVLFGHLTPKEAENEIAKMVAEFALTCYKLGKERRDSFVPLEQDFPLGFN